MTLPILSFSRKPFGLSPWLIVGAAFILGVAVAVLTARNTQREKGYLIQNLLERGEALSWALEAGSRTGMHMGSRERGMLQSLVEETAEQPGIVFLAIVDSQGVFLAHSDPKLVG
jgi:two-component system sensor histidine kinase HydH